MTEPDLLTLRQASVLLCVSYRTVFQWATKGVFARIVRVGPSGAIRLYRVDVEAQRREQRIAS